MDTLKLIALGDLQIGLLMLILSLPLVFRKIPMNRMYGIRIPAAFESEERWYAINAYGGRQLAGWSLPLIAAGVTGFFVSPAHFEWYAYGSLMIAVLVFAMPLLLIMRWSRRN